jgi:hypothetical protein
MEGRRGDGEELELPAAQLRLMQVQPLKRPMQGRIGGERGDASVCGSHGWGSLS